MGVSTGENVVDLDCVMAVIFIHFVTYIMFQNKKDTDSFLNSFPFTSFRRYTWSTF
jgi:hypothetical protein